MGPLPAFVKGEPWGFAGCGDFEPRRVVMFTHRDQPARVASIAPKGDGKSFVVQHTSADGKVRTKTFANGYLAALRFLLNLSLIHI